MVSSSQSLLDLVRGHGLFHMEVVEALHLQIHT